MTPGRKSRSRDPSASHRRPAPHRRRRPPPGLRQIRAQAHRRAQARAGAETEELYKKSILTQNLCELRNMINVGYLIIKNAQNMRESRGLHYSLDYPKSKGSEF